MPANEERAPYALAAVAFANFLFAGLFLPRFGALAPFAGSFFYVLTIMVERCAYSCGFMNPAVVFATHAHAGDLSDLDSVAHVATYFVGAMAGAAGAAAVVSLAEQVGMKKTSKTSKKKATMAASAARAARAAKDAGSVGHGNARGRGRKAATKTAAEATDIRGERSAMARRVSASGDRAGRGTKKDL